MILPPGPFGAYLFDCDGTIADSMPLHYQAWLKAVGEFGGQFPKELFLAWAGIPVPKTVEMLNEKFGLSMPVQEVTTIRERAYLDLMPGVKAVPEVAKVIFDSHGRIPMAVASGSPRASVIETLSHLGLVDRFEHIIGAEDYTKGKPHPDPYLVAARRLGVEVAHCLVFEDADLGVQSAVAAGMRWVKVPQRF